MDDKTKKEYDRILESHKKYRDSKKDESKKEEKPMTKETKGMTKLAKLKMGVTGELPKEAHSPAGREHLTKKAMEKAEKSKSKLLTDYAQGDKFKGASGDDLKELQKKFGKK